MEDLGSECRSQGSECKGSTMLRALRFKRYSRQTRLLHQKAHGRRYPSVTEYRSRKSEKMRTSLYSNVLGAQRKETSF